MASAEDALSEAFAAALTDWPLRGCPANPEAWLLTVARRKLTDGARRISVGKGIRLAVPEREELSARLGAVLDAIYAAFAESWSDPSGTEIARRDSGSAELVLDGSHRYTLNVATGQVTRNK